MDGKKALVGAIVVTGLLAAGALIISPWILAETIRLKLKRRRLNRMVDKTSESATADEKGA